MEFSVFFKELFSAERISEIGSLTPEIELKKTFLTVVKSMKKVGMEAQVRVAPSNFGNF